MTRPTNPVVDAVAQCPFCGSEAEVEQRIIGGLSVCCQDDDCAACGPIRDTEAEAITAWNTRQSADAALVEALERVLDHPLARLPSAVEEQVRAALTQGERT